MTDDPLLTLGLPSKTEKVEGFADVEPKKENTPADVEAVRGTRDRRGNAFDPTIHQFPPEQTPLGKWKKKPKERVMRPGQPATYTADTPNAQYRKEAEAAALQYAQAHALLFGPDAALQNPSELTHMADSWELYFHRHGVKQLPPWVGVLVTHTAYTMSVTKRPKVRERINSLGAKLRALFTRGKQNASTNRGQQPERQNVASEKSDAGPSTRG